MGAARHKEKLIFRTHHPKKKPPMCLSSQMPYVFGYQHIYPNTQDYYFIWRAVEQGQETLANTGVQQ